MLDRKAFYDSVRRSLFGGNISNEQFIGMENLLDVWADNYFDIDADQLAYNLATAFHETAFTMQPIMERGSRSYFNKYEPGTRIGKVLGNTKPGDGYRFRGAGHVQNTGRRNAQKATDELNKRFNLGVDLVANPDMRLDPFISAHSLFLGNLMGWWTGKSLTDYLDGVDESDAEDEREFILARYVVNGTDKRTQIAKYALKFERALRDAGYRKSGAPPPPPVSRNAGVYLWKGDKGERVAELIRDLYALNLYHGTLDDFFWTRTEKAVRDFQDKHDLVMDGVAGPVTLDAIDAAVKKGGPVNPKEAAVAVGVTAVTTGIATGTGMPFAYALGLGVFALAILTLWWVFIRK